MNKNISYFADKQIEIMNLDDIYKNGVHTIEGTLIDLNCLTESDYPLIEELFSDSSVNLYFVLREDHRADLRLLHNICFRR